MLRRKTFPGTRERVTAAAELHVNATYHAQYPALKSVYGKDQSVIPGHLFSSSIGQCSVQGFLEIPKQVTWLASMKHLSRKKHWPFESFLCALSLSSVLGRFIHIYWTIPEKEQTGGLMIWNFQGYWRNSKWVFQLLIKSHKEFPGVIQKNSCGISRGLGFRP